MELLILSPKSPNGDTITVLVPPEMKFWTSKLGFALSVPVR